MSAGILGFLFGLFIGSIFGFFLLAVLTASRDDKDR